MLSIRRRGSAGKWYVRGSVTLGDRSIDVTEFSTGTTDKAAARHLMGERERELREELMFGPRVVAKRAVIADAFDAYLSKPKRPNSSDILRVGVMNDRIGRMALSDPIRFLNPMKRWKRESLISPARSRGNRPSPSVAPRKCSTTPAITAWPMAWPPSPPGTPPC